MNECVRTKEKMAEAYYGELGPDEKARFEAHLRDCPRCAAEYAETRAALDLMDKRERPDPGPEFWDGCWDRLSRRALWENIEEDDPPAAERSIFGRLGRVFGRLPSWSYATAGAAAILLIGILIGTRLVPQQQAPMMTAGANARATAPVPDIAAPPAAPAVIPNQAPVQATTQAPVPSAKVPARSPIVRAGAAGPAVAAPSKAVLSAESFIDRSKVLLLGLVNFDPGTKDTNTLDLVEKKAFSRELAAQAPAIRRALKDERGRSRLRELVSDLELILLQIANLESEQDLEGVELVRQGVDQKSIFMKINLDRMGRETGRGTSGKIKQPVQGASL